MTQLDRYLARKELAPFLATIVIVVAILSLENIARLMDLVTGTKAPMTLLARLMLALIPEYLAVALPLASFIAPAWAFRSLALRGEWQLFAVFGRSPWRIMLAPLAIAGLAAAMQLAIRMEGEPLGERTLDAVARDIRDGEFGLPVALNEFVALDDKTTIFASPPNTGQAGIGSVFIKRGSETFSAERATAGRNERGQIEIGLYNGLGLFAQGDGSIHTLNFEYYRMHFASNQTFMPDLNLSEQLDRMPSFTLGQGASREAAAGLTRKPMMAALLARVSSAFLCLILPWLAFALAVPPRRKVGGAASFLGFVVIVLFMRTSNLIENGFQNHPIAASTFHLSAWAAAVFALFRYCSTREDGAIDLALARIAVRMRDKVRQRGSGSLGLGSSRSSAIVVDGTA